LLNSNEEAPTMMGGFDGGAGWGRMGAFGWGGMLLIWLAVIVLVAWALRTFLSSDPPSDPPSGRRDDGDAALAILRRRYAIGEITQTEYEQARRVLNAPDPAIPAEERRQATSRS